ncbi:MAG: hypothetical protein ABI624_09015 [Casimicrobiaceae bacterium]
MRHAVHLLLILLLTVAVPLRVATAATMVLCGPTHERLAQSMQADIRADVADHHAHPGMQHPHPHVHEAVADAAQSSHGDVVDTVKHAEFKCALCGACCAGGFGIASSSLVVPALEVVSLAFPPLVVAFAGWHPDGLERPPHSHLV